MSTIYFIVSFLSSIIGSICGIGGGVIIKPVLDAASSMPLDSIGFLSGTTVLSMSIVSVFRTMRSKSGPQINIMQSTYLALGGATGGLLGKKIFDYAFNFFANKNLVGAIQATCLILVTVGALAYQLNKHKITTKRVDRIWLYITIGILLGIMSSFLGIGGGPINLVVLAFFFSHDTKTAAINSLYIIMFSQFISFITTLTNTSMTYPPYILLALMILGGIAGSLVGGKINKGISSAVVDKLFVGLIVVTINLNVYNLVGFLR